MRITNLTEEINSRLIIKSTKGMRFGNDKIQFESSGLSLYHPVLGFVSFGKDKYGINIPYVPVGGRKALNQILSDGGLTDYANAQWAKPIA